MLESNLQKKPTKKEMENKVNAWKTLNEILVKANAEFMKTLRERLAEKEALAEGLKIKLEKNEGSAEENAEYLFVQGYIQGLKDILNAKAQ